MSYGGGGSSSSGSVHSDSDVALNNPSDGQALSYNASLQKWQNNNINTSATALQSQTIYADTPPAAAGSAVSSSTADNGALINTLLTYVKNTYGGGQVVLPAGVTLPCTTGITVPAKVRLIGHGRTTSVLSYSSASTSVVAITLNDQDSEPLEGLGLVGPATGGNNNWSSGSSIGIDVTGVGLRVRNVQVNNFHINLQLTNDQSYINSFISSNFGNSPLDVSADFYHNPNTGNPAVNSGERFVFDDCGFYNSQQFLLASGTGTDMYFHGCSIDSIISYASFTDGDYGFANCHFELSSTSGPTFMFTGEAYPHVHITNCEFVMGGGGIKYLWDPSTQSYGVGGGICRVLNSHAYWVDTTGNGDHDYGQRLVSAASGATTYSLYSFFLSKWSQVRVSIVAWGTNYPPAGITASVTNIDYTTGQVTVSFSSALPSTTWLLFEW